MRPYAAKTAAVKWYYIIWATYRRRRVFKIPALRRFCEQSIRLKCVHTNWRVECAAVSADRVRLLVCASARVSRDALLHDLKRSVALAVRDTGAVRVPRRPWDNGAWCASVSSGAGIEVVRRYVERMSATPAPRSDWERLMPPTLQYERSFRAASTMSGVWGST